MAFVRVCFCFGDFVWFVRVCCFGFVSFGGFALRFGVLVAVEWLFGIVLGFG